MESQGTNNSAQLDFSQAMADFKVMFPNMDNDVIEAVLRSNNGAVDATIDQLLTMTADIESSSPGGGGAPDNSLPSYTEAVDSVGDLLGATSLRDTGQEGLMIAGAGRGEPLRRIKNWNPPLLGKLPPDFLRLTPRGGSAGSRAGHSYTHPDRPHHHHSGARARPGHSQGEAVSQQQMQMVDDEKFAMMLQNEEFMRELRGNQEFMSALEAEHNHDFSQTDSDFHHQPLDRPREHTSARRPHLGTEDAVFREKLKNMGKSSKQKFAKLATMFSRQKGVSRVLGHAPAPSRDNLLLNADPSAHNRRLEDSDSEEEGHCTTKVSHCQVVTNSHSCNLWIFQGRKYQLM